MTSVAKSVLILEDDENIAELIEMALSRAGWNTTVARTLSEGRRILDRKKPLISIVDLGLPDGNGLDFVRGAASTPGMGIMVVSGLGDEVDRIVALELGADDYIAKPFSSREMVARVRALGRRLEGQTAPVSRDDGKEDGHGEACPSSIRLGPVVAEPKRHRLRAVDGREVRLTGGEASLLSLLIGRPDEPVERDDITMHVFGRPKLPEQRSADQLACSLRRKLQAASSGQVSVAAVRGRGYRLTF